MTECMQKVFVSASTPLDPAVAGPLRSISLHSDSHPVRFFHLFVCALTAFTRFVRQFLQTCRDAFVFLNKDEHCHSHFHRRSPHFPFSWIFFPLSSCLIDAAIFGKIF